MSVQVALQRTEGGGIGIRGLLPGGSEAISLAFLRALKKRGVQASGAGGCCFAVFSPQRDSTSPRETE